MTTFDGTVYRRGDEGYETARCAAVWNALKPKRFPAVIVVAGSRDDVVRAVNLARAEGLQIGIRSGGHSWVGNAVRDGGLLLDLSHLKAVEVDLEAGTATVEAGVRVDELSAALAAHGMYFPFGHCPSVGVTGFVLGGGYGFNSAQVGLGAGSVHAVDVVTADGEALHANDDEYADVMWAARGAGPGFFAVVTRLHVDLRPLPAVIASSVQVHPLSAYDELIDWYVKADHPGLLVAGANPAVGGDQKVLMLVSYTFADTLEQAAANLAPLESAPGLDRALLHISAQPTTHAALCATFDAMYPEGLRYLSDNLWVNDTSAQGLWRDAKQIIDELPNSTSTMWLIPGTMMGDGPPPNAAFSLQAKISFQVYGGYTDSAQDEEMLAWHTDAIQRIDKYSLGAGYVGDSNLFAHPVAILHPDSAARLEALRQRYDPDGRFYSYPSELPSARI
ncbi:FAD-binding oxidoreductase [Mycolicibacterium sp. CBM1]